MARGRRSRCCSPGGTQGIALDRETLRLEVVEVADGDWQAAGVIVHDVTNRSIAHMLVEMPFGPFPMALGVLYDDPRPTFEAAVAEERAKASAGKEPNLARLLAKGQTWTVGGYRRRSGQHAARRGRVVRAAATDAVAFSYTAGTLPRRCMPRCTRLAPLTDAADTAEAGFFVPGVCHNRSMSNKPASR